MKQLSLFIYLSCGVTAIKGLIKKIVQLENYLVLTILFANGALAETPPEDIRGKQYSPAVGTSYPINVYWGDTHLHTNLSLDAYNYGNRGLGPEEAYRFAKGERVKAHNGMNAQLRRPLDFLVIADHASNMGVMNGLEAGNPDLLSSEVGADWASRLKEINEAAENDAFKATELSVKLFLDGILEDIVADDRYQHFVWQESAALADKHNDPGKFTAFIGYEWTQLFYNLHRVVIFKDGAKKAGQVIPFSQYDSSDPEDLWRYLEAYQAETGGEVLAIPHNGNLSTGVMFALEDAKGNPFSRDYAKTRSRWEPLFEVTQTKGDSETHPILSPTDEFADYEKKSNDVYLYKDTKKSRGFVGYDSWINKNNQASDASWMRAYEYGRSALKLGLAEKAKLGINPFKFGMIGSTDSHTSLATADEDNFWGIVSEAEPHKDRVLGPVLPASNSKSSGWEMSASGYAAIWAEENTREALFAAMKRKEVYASTGPRMTVRFFGGWDYQSEDAFKPDLAQIGYAKGVPMGGDLTNAPKNKAPSFLIRAVKDPDGANLDRVQVIKGWHDKQGELHEKIYNVALSDGRQENWRGKIKPVGNTVNIADASYTNSIGDPELAVVWKDPDFDKDELAFYYVRVLEIPTPRWSAYDAKFFGIKDISDEVPMVTQERAYTSPIWYSPEEHK